MQITRANLMRVTRTIGTEGGRRAGPGFPNTHHLVWRIHCCHYLEKEPRSLSGVNVRFLVVEYSYL